MASLQRRAIIFGVISPMIRISTVITNVTMVDAVSSVILPSIRTARFTASTVATEVAQMFTRLLPTSTVDSA